MKSKIYTGSVYHKRIVPKPHAFSYQLSMFWINLDEIEYLDQLSCFWSFKKFNLAWWRRQDYFPNHIGNLKHIVQAYVEKQSQLIIEYVFLLTHPRYLGIGFNPLSLYYCFDAALHLKAVVAEVTNTPWLERHYYFLPVTAEQKQRIKLNKSFHVSPFLPMDLAYEFEFNHPDDQLDFHMEIFNKENEAIFKAGMHFTAEHINKKSLNRLLFRFPWQTLKIITGIYWQAIRLWLKKIPYYPHP